MSQTKYALVLWFNDKPVAGNAIRLESVKKARKEPEDYKVGDLVFANCHGFGVCEGVLAKIEGMLIVVGTLYTTGLV